MSLFIGIFALYTVAMYLYDPMHIISNKEQLFNGSMRYQARGYLENKNVKGLIIGTSMLEIPVQMRQLQNYLNTVVLIDL